MVLIVGLPDPVADLLHRYAAVCCQPELFKQPYLKEMDGKF